jgi:transposase
MNAETLRESCWHTCQALRENHTPAVPYSLIGRILGIDRGTVKYHSKRCEGLGATLRRNGRPSILSGEHRKDLVRQIKEAYHHDILWTIAEILQFCQERAAEALDWNSVYHWLHHEPCRLCKLLQLWD